MNVFVLNAGSSSVKAAYFEGPGGAPFPLEPDWSAEIRWTTLPARTDLRWTSATGSGTQTVTIDEHGSAASAMLTAAMETFGIAPDLVGHRVVHGLTESACAIVDPRVRSLIERAAELAPLHNRAALAGIDAVAVALPGVPQAVDFDTAFHTTLPPEAAAYALPYAWYTERGIRRYGFHGISHKYCAGRTAELLGRDAAGLRMVSAHLGNGCSLAAVRDGRSVETTMGYTPLDGLMMGSRSGSIDPGLVLHLLGQTGCGIAELDTLLNTASGLKGVSQVSEDIRDVIAAADGGAAPARLALDMYVHRLAAGVAAMAAATGGIDALSFTGGVGEHSAYVRERVCAKLGFLGVAPVVHATGAGSDFEAGAPDAPVRVFAIRAREEYAIARDVARLVAREPRRAELQPR